MKKPKKSRKPVAKRISPTETPMRPGKHGGKLRTGNPGNKGGTGRPPNELRNWLADLRKKPSVQDALERAASDEYSRGFAAAWKILTDYDPDRPKGEDSGKAVHVHVHGPPTGVERPEARKL